MLSLSHISIAISGTSIITDLSMHIASGTIHALMGPNGSGKSTLAYTLMGHPKYQVISGSLVYNKIDLVGLTLDKRAQAGIFLAFQNPYVLPGVTVFSFLKTAYESVHKKQLSVVDCRAMLYAAMDILDMDYAFATREVNVGFSGGEKKRLELLSMLVLRPTLVILDEIDSGLDIDALQLVAKAISALQTKSPKTSCIVITHYPRLLEYVRPDYVHILVNGKLVESGNASLAKVIENRGYDGRNA